MDPQAIMNYLGPCIPAGKKNLFKILWMHKVSGMSDNVIWPDKKQADPSTSALAKMKQKYSGKLLLNVMGTDIMQRFYGQKGVMTGMENLMSGMRTGADLSIAVISHSQEDVLDYLSEVSDMHLHFLMINDTLLLQSLVPASTLYSVVFDGHQINLEPVV
jgi:hypothetical protein